jgi:hypothetical protein
MNPGQRHLKYTEAGSAIHSEPAGKGRKKKNKKTLVLTLGSPPGKGGKKKKTLVLTLGSSPEKGGKNNFKKKPWY